MLFKAFQLTSITQGNVIYYTQPIFLPLFGMSFFHEKISKIKWLFILLGFVGVVLILNIDLPQWSVEKRTLIGSGCALTAGLFYALATILAKKMTHVDSKHITIAQLLIGAIVLFPLTANTSCHFTMTQ